MMLKASLDLKLWLLVAFFIAYSNPANVNPDVTEEEEHITFITTGTKLSLWPVVC